ncbi:DUF5590 domain-containing protein [Bacillus aquiflavi]|uniref:DUF5590 domain-containing protein n=1 Tax=Bacillus aquiflavi TaxID=2672567 RepID=A0A6B3VY82_9BACI|nr:DUF5590 domain-containing protein [Bacillus aquiflavi]MBA4536112.1 DUF5590 domain-containing protein [Bacillus aquiflavi]NEY80486.1 peptidase [Bacillus aquiflavi]
MKKWILIISAIVVIVIGVFFKLYYNAVSPMKKAEETAIIKAKKETKLVSIGDVYTYNGKETSYAVTGKNEKKEDIIVFIPEKKGKAIVKKASEGISKKEAVNIVKSEKNPKEIISVRMGMENNVPLWEVYYLGDDGLLNYYYIHFETGEWLKKIENL